MKKIEDVGLEHVYASVSEIGKREGEYRHIKEFNVIKQLLQDVRYLLNARLVEEKLVADTLKEIGVLIPKNANALYIAMKTLLNSKVILDNEEYVALESVNGYITKASNIGGVYKKEYVDQFENLLNGCYQDLGAMIKLDEEKQNLIGTL